ncbi:MAG: tetratricopeptide repeat protein [Archangium sp.]|nr:tetratricopeptide repeat protein [Archangium sp.]
MRQAYSIREVAGLLGTTGDSARALVELVWGAPRDVFTFQDLVLLRTARGLMERRVSRTRIARALEKLRKQLADGRPLSSVALQQEGEELVVGVGEERWNAETGQSLLDFHQPSRAATWHKAPAQRDADALFARAVAQEGEESPDALATYTEALAVNPLHADAHVNLGRLLHQRGCHKEAEAHYTAALVARPADVTATFNLAVVLDDQGRIDEAMSRYRETLELDPHCVDAYFNLARLYERKGEKIAAIRHLKDYRRLSNQAPA